MTGVPTLIPSDRLILSSPSVSLGYVYLSVRLYMLCPSPGAANPMSYQWSRGFELTHPWVVWQQNEAET